MAAKNTLFSCLDKLKIYVTRRNELKKFHDKRRIAILNKVNLTDEQKKQIDDFYLSNYGEKIPYTWHRNFTAFTGNFDFKYFPELLYIPEFEHFMNCNVPYYKVFEDKNVMPIIAETAGVKTPEAVLTCSDGYYRDGDYNLMSRNGAVKLLKNLSSSGENEFFIKPTVGSSSGRGCRIIKLNDENFDDIINSAGQNFTIQKLLHCHDDIAKIYPHSVNTFRIISYIWHDEIIACPIILRIGQGGNYVDNAHTGGMFIAVDNDGTMHERAFTEFRDEFTEHPDTHLKFKGYKISGVPEMIAAAKRMHSMMPQVGIINWDFTIDKDCKPVLIEGNLRGGGIWVIQMAHGCGPFGENTAEILRWTRAMKKLKPHERIAMKNNFTF